MYVNRLVPELHLIWSPVVLGLQHEAPLQFSFQITLQQIVEH